MKPRVLFLCTHNSARSQMAEGFLRHRGGDRFEVASAGTEARGVNPWAARVMAEVGIDISGQHSKTLDGFLGEGWDYVVTVCDGAREACPVFPRAARQLHWSFDDPSRATGSDGERLAVFRRVRDEIDARIAGWLAALDAAPTARPPRSSAGWGRRPRPRAPGRPGRPGARPCTRPSIRPRTCP